MRVHYGHPATIAPYLEDDMSATDSPPTIDHDHIHFESTRPFNTSGGSSELYVGFHETAGKVAVKRLRYLSDQEEEEEAARVSP